MNVTKSTLENELFSRFYEFLNAVNCDFDPETGAEMLFGIAERYRKKCAALKHKFLNGEKAKTWLDNEAKDFIDCFEVPKELKKSAIKCLKSLVSFYSERTNEF